MRTTDAIADAPAVQTHPTSMRAVTHAAYGGPKTLTTARVAVPTPDASQVLVEVAAAGIDRGVWHLVTGRPYLMRLAGYGVRAEAAGPRPRPRWPCRRRRQRRHPVPSR